MSSSNSSASNIQLFDFWGPHTTVYHGERLFFLSFSLFAVAALIESPRALRKALCAPSRTALDGKINLPARALIRQRLHFSIVAPAYVHVFECSNSNYSSSSRSQYVRANPVISAILMSLHEIPFSNTSY
uniref:Uncharacterized protein n=1 Tax=Trichogramma kaykai TaxID=54128 RepID=A0ABD2X3I6_9HYME